MTEIPHPQEQTALDEEPRFIAFSEISAPDQNVELKYPHALFKRQQESLIDPKDIAIYAVMIGVLADRGYLLQPIGKEKLEIKVSDFEEYPLYSEEIARERNDQLLELKLSSITTKIIAQSSSFPINANDQRYRLSLIVDSERISKWFLKSLSLWQMHNGEDQVELVVEDERFSIDYEGVRGAWEKSGFPEPIFKLVNLASGKKQDLLIHIPVDEKGPIARGF